MVASASRALERIRYWQGQLLASGDLHTQMRVDQELRRLHDRAVHQAFGIAIGLTTSLQDGVISLGCGMAYDCTGRGLIVERDRTIRLPSVRSPMTLVLASDLGRADGIALRWTPAKDVHPATEIAITRLLPGAAGPEIDPAFRPLIARPMAWPRIATGTTIPGNTAWKSWTINAVDVGVQVRIDTSAAGYTKTPYYFAEAVAAQPTPDFYPAWLASIADPSPEGFTLRLLLRRITRESLDIARDLRAQVSGMPKLDRTIPLAAGNSLRRQDLVARLLPLAEQFSKITALEDDIATVSLGDFTGTKAVAFGNTPRTAKVVVTPKAGSKEVKLDRVLPFANGDLVAKVLQGAASSVPVHVDNIMKDEKTLVLRDTLPGLAMGDTLGAADFRVRATVLGVTGKTVTVAQAAVFPGSSFVAALDEDLKPGLPVRVGDAAGTTLTLDGEIDKLAQGDVIGSCAFPLAVPVESILPDGHIVVVGGNLLHAGDVVVVEARSGMALVAEAAGPLLRLASPILDLAEGDSLAVATVRGVVNVTSDSPGKVKVETASLLRRSDFLADIVGWRMAGTGTGATAYVTKATDTEVTLASILDGVLPGDTIGLADAASQVFQLRLNKMPNLIPGDEVRLAGLDRRRGETRSLFGYVIAARPEANLIFLAVEPSPGAFALRPDDISASILFVRGSALALIQKLDLFVSWLACADPDPMPRPCAGAEVPDCPCAPLKE